MTITWYGQSCFRIDTREAVLAIDPFSKGIGLTPPRFRADILLITHPHPDHANAEAIGGEPTVIAGPGEYEVKGVTIRGIPTFHDAEHGKRRGANTAFTITAEGLRVVHLGDFGESSLREETAEAIGATDVLLIPVGGTYTIDGAAAAKIVSHIEPKLAIPMHFALPGLTIKLAPVEGFLRAWGGEPERLPKLSLRTRDLAAERTRVTILELA